MIAAGDADKRITVLLAVDTDPKNRSSAQQFMGDVRKQEKEAIASAERVSKERIKAEQAAEREADRIHHRHRERQRQQASENRRDREQESREAERAAKWRSDVRVRSMANARALESKTAQEAERAHVQSVARMAAADRALITSGMRIASGVTNIARAFVVLGVASEKDLEKALRTFAKFEAGVALMRGLANVVMGAAAAWRAYAAAQAAAAAAEAARGTVSGGSAAAGGAIGAGAGRLLASGAGATALAGTAAAASWGAVGYEVYEMLSGKSHSPGSFTDTIAQSENAVDKWLARNLGYNAPDYIKTEIASEDRLKRASEAYHLEQEQRSINSARASALNNASYQSGTLRAGRIGGRSVAEAFGVTDARRRYADLGIAEAGSRYSQSPGAMLDRIGRQAAIDQAMQAQAAAERARQVPQLRVLQGHISAVQARADWGGPGSAEAQQEVLRLRKEQLELVQRMSQTEIEASKTAVSNLEKQRDAYLDIAKSEQDRLRSATEKLAFADPAKQRQLLRDFDTVQGGGSLGSGRRALERAKDLVDAGLADRSLLEKAARAEVDRLGLGRALRPLEDRAAEANQRATAVQANIDAEVKHTIELQMDADQVADSMKDKLANLIEEVGDQLAFKVTEEIRRKFAEQRAKDQADGKTGDVQLQ